MSAQAKSWQGQLRELRQEVAQLRELLEAIREVVVVPLPAVCNEENLRALEAEQRGRAVSVRTCVEQALERPAFALTWARVLRDREPLPYEPDAEQVVSNGK